MTHYVIHMTETRQHQDNEGNAIEYAVSKYWNGKYFTLFINDARYYRDKRNAQDRCTRLINEGFICEVILPT